MDQIKTLLEHLEDKKLSYVMARARTDNDTSAMREAGVSRGCFYSWPEEERNNLNNIAQQVKRETATIALMKLQSAAVKAAEVKIAALDSRNDSIKQHAATEILDRTVGPSTQKVDITSGGETIKVKLVGADE